MKAVVYHQYGPPDVLRLEEIPAPSPGDREVLVGVRAAALNPLDSHLMRGNPRLLMGLRKPKQNRPGVDMAGRVEAVGRNVTRFRPGDEVFGTCKGAFAECAVASESKIVAKPGNITFEEAAAAPVAALTALQGLRDSAKIHRGSRVLIHGAAGGCGTFAVQIGKWLGAEVTGVCRTQNMEMLRSLGADHVIDYTREDFTRGQRRYDAIFDFVADHSVRECYRVLEPGGLCIGAGILGMTPSGRGLVARPVEALLLAPFAKRKFKFFMAKVRQDDLATIGELLQTGVIKSVIDRRFPLKEVADALRYLEQKHARGKIILTVP